jgi:F-type H+-transporting ATPase subunit c
MKVVTVAVVVMMGLLASGYLFAQTHQEKEKVEQAPSDVKMMLAAAIGFGLAVAVFGGAIGQSSAIRASVEAMARQPEVAGRIFGSMVIGLALIETLVIYMLLICFMLLGKFTFTVPIG